MAQPSAAQIYNVTGAEVWNSGNSGQISAGTLSTNLFIKSGGSLTINNLNFSVVFGKVFNVEVGGELVIDGCTITSATSNGWEGIKVFGDNTIDQYTAGNFPYGYTWNSGVLNPNQTYCKINNCNISNAKNGIYSIAGGITEVVGCTFTNCFKSFIVENYTQPTQAHASKNACHISSSVIEINTEMAYVGHTNQNGAGSGIPDFGDYILILLTNVHGVHIDGCTLKNTYAGARYSYNQWGTGIYSTSASYTLEPGTFTGLDNDGCPVYSGTNSSFDGLSWGANASKNANNNDYSLVIYKLQTSNTDAPLLIKDPTKLVVSNSVLDISNLHLIHGSASYNAGNNVYYGLKVTGGNNPQLVIKDNEVRGKYNTTESIPYKLMWFDNCGVAKNLIYKNLLNMVTGSTDPNLNEKGLVFSGTNKFVDIRCNTFMNCNTDIMADKDAAGLVTFTDKIGLTTSAAGNNFSKFSFNYNSIDISKWTGFTTTYFYSGGGNKLPNPNLGAVFSNPAQGGEVCPTLNCMSWPVGFTFIYEGNNSLYIYPNPANTELTIELKDKNPTKYMVSIYDIQGKVVSIFSSSDNSFKIDVSAYSKGLYLLQIADGDNTHTSKFVVQ